MVGARQADRRRLALAAMLVTACCAGTAHAADEPLWEFGLGIGAIAFEDYRGANTSHVYPLPVPYFVYNGEFLKADRDGVRGLLFHQNWIELNVSVNATTPVRSDLARSGMPDLKSTVEFGPSLDIHLLKSAGSRVKLDLRMPLRAAFTVESPPRYIGWTFNPRLALDVSDPFGFIGWKAGLLAGPLYTDRKYDDYFYTVAPQYATLTRPAYQADGGYAGTQFLAALSKRYPKYWVGAYMRYDSLAGAAFADSPLVQTRSYWSVGFGIAWMISKSSRTVVVPD
jgi:outer membrane protein